MRILFLIGSLSFGGAEKILTELVKNIDKERNEITVMTVFNKGDYVEEVKKNANYKYIFNNNLVIKNNVINRITKKVLSYLPAKLLYRLFIKENYDIEIAFIEGISTKIISGSNKNSNKFAWVHTDPTVHGWSTQSFSSLKYERVCYKNFNKIFTVSSSVRKGFYEKYGQFNNVYTQLNILDQNTIKNRSKIKIDNLEEIIGNSGVNLITVGRLVKEKGYLRLVKVIKRLLDEGVKCKLNIIGEGIEREGIEDYINKNKLQENINILGYRENPYNYMKKSDLYVCSSITEGLSTVVIEAIILGLPVITTDCAGMVDILGDSEYGLITTNDEEGLYNGLKKILIDDKLRQHYKEKACIRSEFFKLENRMKEFNKILQNKI